MSRNTIIKSARALTLWAIIIVVTAAGITARADTEALRPSPAAPRVGPSGFIGIPSYYSQLDFNLTSPGAFASAAGGYANPALYAMMPGDELEYFWTVDDNTGWDRIDRWGLFLGLENLGFGAVHNRVPKPDGTGMLSVTDYRLALSLGTKKHSAGMALGWSRGDTDQMDRSTIVQLGTVYRFNRYVSGGLAGLFSTEKDQQSGLADLAIRPLGNRRLAVFGDLEMPRRVSLEDFPWSAGAMLEVVDGIRLVGRYFEDESFALSLTYSSGVGVATGVARATGSARFDSEGEHCYTNYGFRLGYAEHNVESSYFQNDKYYLNMNLRGPIVHSRYKYFDDGQTLQSILISLENARTDERIKGVALNLSGARMSFGMAWEIRDKLEQLQKDGKHVAVFVDEVSMTTYHLASVADRIVMDSNGMIILAGYVMGRTYMTNLLDKLGLGFDEWRFLKYKSAVESFSRHSMSDADREQRQALVDEYYNTVKTNVTASRGISASRFDEWVDEFTLISPSVAMKEGMVDTLGSWEDVKEVIGKLEGSKKTYVGASALAKNYFKSKRWGELDRVALVYALGECAMDTGINARRLEKIFQNIQGDNRVKAVVFRVNSPGGSALASDVVVRALKKCSEKKPVIVSQADVAGSGGYWISMYADEIIAQPTTITGSIGVIGGWVWNNGLGDKIGLEGDFVKKGEHADLLFGLTLPFIGVSVPLRPLTEEERDQVLGEMEIFYDEFVEKVAKGRGMKPEAVENVAQGRVWTGIQGKEVGLIDRIGGLEVAFAVAREKAGIDPAEEVEVVEYGTKGLVNLAWLNPLPFSINWGKTEDTEKFDPGFAGFAGWADHMDGYELMYLRAITKNNGRALCLIPPDYLPREATPASD